MLNGKEQMFFFLSLFLIFIGLYKDNCNYTDINHVLIYLCFTAVVSELTLKVNSTICSSGRGIQKTLTNW